LNKQDWLDFAEAIDALRLIPRLLLVSYCAFVFWLTDRLLTWYFALPASERSLEASGLAGGIFTAATGLATIFLNTYLKSGRNWNASLSE